MRLPLVLWRHLVSSPLAKHFFSSRLQYSAKSTSSFQQIHLFISADISLNPGLLTQSQSAKSKDILDRLYPTLCGELSSSKGLEIGHLNVNGCFTPRFWVLLRLKTHQEDNVKGIYQIITTSRRFKCVPQILGSSSIHIFRLLFLLLSITFRRIHEQNSFDLGAICPFCLEFFCLIDSLIPIVT